MERRRGGRSDREKELGGNERGGEMEREREERRA